jgi:uncharacterized protein YdeI (YjbR/CyaY-like superfamily)
MRTSLPAEFRTPGAFRTWLEHHHKGTPELTIRLFRVHAAEKGITYSQALDEALCFGWIDGVRRSYDKDSFITRFSPRRRGSIWSRINVGHVGRLIKEGRVTAAGLAAFQAKDEKKSGVYSFENRPIRLSALLGKAFRAEKVAWAYFQTQAPWYRRTSIYWVMSAKQKETRERRLGILISCSRLGKSIPLLERARRAGA